MKSEPTEQEVFTYLDGLREQGLNMQWATIYIIDKFAVDFKRANRILALWNDRKTEVKKPEKVNSQKPRS